MITRLAGVRVDTGQETEFWVVDGRVTYSRVAGEQTVVSGWILPGLVDAHAHIGLDAGGAVDRTTSRTYARADLAAGVTLIRDLGSPADLRWAHDEPGLPRLITAGRHIARPRRYIRGLAVEVEPEDLAAEMRRQALAGDGWVKLVGDWIDREAGDLTPLWPVEAVREGIVAAHAAGARVTAHCFGEQSVFELVRAGIDCIEHGCGLDADTCSLMAARAVALVPTLDNWQIFPGLADQGEARYPAYAAHMRALYARRTATIRQALAAGVPVYAGTDAGGTRAHGTLGPEIAALAALGGPEFALGAASWRAREWLGAGTLDEGAPADLLVLPRDPRRDLTALAAPSLILLGGVPYGPSNASGTTATPSRVR
ncbi:MAG: amidohydrolase family protein [Propionibacteriaceae bacterium]|nr:amidohydrolase family protein [Propionibacteriaceae bacterium]